MISKHLIAVSLMLLLFFTLGCSQPKETDTPDKIRVVTTINILGDLIETVAGDRIDVFHILPVGGDPHIYQPVPRDLITISQADAVFCNGLTLELWLQELIENAGGERPTYILTEGLEPHYQQGGEWDGHPDPHLWMDPLRTIRYVENIRNALIELDPARTEEYTLNAATYIDALQELDAWMRTEFEVIPPACRKLITTHDAYRYFGESYDFEIIGTIWGISTDEEPSAKEIAALVTLIRDVGVPAVYIESTVNPKLLQQVANEANAEIGGILYGDSLGALGSGAETYVMMMQSNTRIIAEGLSKGCNP